MNVLNFKAGGMCVALSRDIMILRVAASNPESNPNGNCMVSFLRLVVSANAFSHLQQLAAVQRLERLHVVALVGVDDARH